MQSASPHALAPPRLLQACVILAPHGGGLKTCITHHYNHKFSLHSKYVKQKYTARGLRILGKILPVILPPMLFYGSDDRKCTTQTNILFINCRQLRKSLPHSPRKKKQPSGQRAGGVNTGSYVPPTAHFLPSYSGLKLSACYRVVGCKCMHYMGFQGMCTKCTTINK